MADSTEMARQLVGSIPAYTGPLLQSFDAVKEKLVREIARMEEHLSNVKTGIQQGIREGSIKYAEQLRSAKSALERAKRETNLVLQSIVLLAEETLSTRAFEKELDKFVDGKTSARKNPLLNYCKRVADRVNDALKALDDFRAADDEAQKALEGLESIISSMKKGLHEKRVEAADKESISFTMFVALGGLTIGACSIIAAPALASATVASLAPSILPFLGIGAAERGVNWWQQRGEKKLYERAAEGVEEMEAQGKYMREALSNCEESEAREFVERIQRTLAAFERSVKEEHYGREDVMKALTQLKTLAEKAPSV
eukprot:scpid87881/ scgid30468/ 